MENLINIARGYARFEVTGARAENLLNLLSAQGVAFWKASPITDYKLTFTVRRADAARVKALAARALCAINKESSHGVPEFLYRLRKRYTLLLGLVAIAAVLLWSSFHIWDIEVYGNETVSRARILNALEECGVGIGSYWPDFVTDSIRSRVLVKVPELSYITVNVYGSRAEIIVRERVAAPELVREKVPADVVAEKAGIITQMNVYRGAAKAEAGRTVLPGEVLVSGEVASPFAGTRLVRAMASVKARTWYEMTCVRPLITQRKSYTGNEDTRYSLKIGSKRINFYTNSGSEGEVCDKIVEERPLSVGGLFTLPFTLIVERLSEYETAEVEPDANAARGQMEEELMRALEKELGDSGELVGYEFTALERNGLLLVTLHAECAEEIAAIREIK